MKQIKGSAAFRSFALILLSVIHLNEARGSSFYGYEGEAVVISRSQIPHLERYVRDLSDPRRDAYERVLQVEKVTSSTGHGSGLKIADVLFVQLTNDASKRAVGAYPVELEGGQKALMSLTPGRRFTFSHRGYDSATPGGTIGRATLTVLRFID